MIPFFRKIRYRLAKDSQFFKYSRYAIGEIVLVVIGILIALQINTWNEERKQEGRKKEVTISLVKELNGVMVYTQQQVNLLNQRIEIFTNIIDNWEAIDPKILSEEMLGYYYFAIHTSTLIKYSPKIDYYNSLIGLGEINLIPDSLAVKLNYVYNKEGKELNTYINQEADLHVLIAEVIAKNHSKIFLTAKITDNWYNTLDSASIINLLYSIRNDGELKSLIIRNLTIIKWKQYLLETRVIPELNNLIDSFQTIQPNSYDPLLQKNP